MSNEKVREQVPDILSLKLYRIRVGKLIEKNLEEAKTPWWRLLRHHFLHFCNYYHVYITVSLFLSGAASTSSDSPFC